MRHIIKHKFMKTKICTNMDAIIRLPPYRQNFINSKIVFIGKVNFIQKELSKKSYSQISHV